jgi:hypothetical protein
VRLGRHATEPPSFITRIRSRGQWLYLRGEVGYFEDHLRLIRSHRGVTLLPYSASNDR